MRTPPVFFAEIKANAHRRWEQLEADPDLAGPWRQLFSQVQSPRHVLSELLQNADDAGARSASARIEDGVFIFEHDGEDFQKEHLASLCRFGFSNKRTLHTIGFRGIGFKSTFSLGPSVEVISPTIAVRFEKARFTEPIWISDASDSQSTSIHVKIEDASRAADLEKNLDEWSKSPVSLLFFQNIRKLTIYGMSLERQPKGQGPIPNSERVSLIGKESQDVIIVRSGEEPFPQDAIDEIRRERITGDDDFILPPCKVEAVIGLTGNQRLFVILPTDVQISLPFSCNAPFVQDPARTGIKEPSISPTNRWLLERLGSLIAQAMITWLEDTSLELSNRAMAYDLLPQGTQKHELSEQSPSRIIIENFSTVMGKRNILLASTGALDSTNNCVAPPMFFYSVWTPEQLLRIFESPSKSILATEVTQTSRERLISWGWLKAISNLDTIYRLQVSTDIPKPNEWQSLWLLWEFLLKKMQNQLYGKWSKMVIVPINGESTLFCGGQAVRQSLEKFNLSHQDWHIIQDHLHVVDKDWILYLSGSLGEGGRPITGGPKKELANQILENIGLDKVTSIDIIVNRAFQCIRAEKEIQKDFLIRFTHIIAALDSKIPNDFVYITKDKKYRPVSESLALDRSGDLESILPSTYANSHILDEDYSSVFSSCTDRQWSDWTASTKCGLQQIIGFVKTEKNFYHKTDLSKYLSIHDGAEPSNYPYKGERFSVVEYDFDKSVLAYWQNQSKTENMIWTKIVRLIATDPNCAWKRMMKADLYQRATTGKEHQLVCDNLKSNWIINLRNYPCLEDSHGIPRNPSELLMRSAETELLMGIELFVHPDLDVESRRELIKALGVRTTPSSLDTILQRIKIFSESQNPPIYELEKIYGSIDRLLPKCSTQEINRVKEIFTTEPLIYSDQGTWCTSKDIFQNPDPHDNPGVTLVLPQLRNLQVWTRVGVAEKPTFELILESLKRLSSGQQLDPQTFKRIRSLIARAPIRVWNEYGHWISLDRSWIPVSELMYCYTMQSMFKYGELYPKIKQQTADFQELDVLTIAQSPFSNLKNLKSSLSYKISELPDNLEEPFVKSWTFHLGKKLKHIVLDDPLQQETIRKAAERLEKTVWQVFDNLKIIPFIDGTPAGQSSSPPVFWEGATIYVRDVKPVKIISSICDEIAPPFNSDEIREAIKICVERDESFIEEYLHSNFTFESIRAQLDQSKKQLPFTVLPAANLCDDLFEDPVNEVHHTIPASEISTENAEELVNTENLTDAVMPSPLDDETQPAKLEAAVRLHRSEPSLMDIYTKKFNYVYDDEEKRYHHTDGSWLQRGDDGFTWDMYSPEGEIAYRFWVSKHCLDTNGFEIDAGLYEQVKKSSDTCAFLLIDLEGQPITLTGEELLAQVVNEEIKVFPAKYRLRRMSE